MHGAFATVLWVVCGLSVAGALVALLMSGRDWRDLGGGGLRLDRDPDTKLARRGSAATESEDEIRELIEARNARRLRRGEAPSDVEAEVARLTRVQSDNAPGSGDGVATDPELRAEIRALVEARNARRIRRGEPPIEVEEEVERQMADLRRGGSGEASRSARFPLG